MPREKRTTIPGSKLSVVPLPMSMDEMRRRGWQELDILLVTGDAYVDHPAFGTALIGRVLENAGYRVGIVAQPRWDTLADIIQLGRPRLFAGVSAGALDSMLAHYTAFRKIRHDDAYTPGNVHGARPNRACIVYTNLLRQAFPGLPVVLGGIEASMRRATHYDFWSDTLRRSILLDSKADLIVYGMGERAVLEIAHRLASSSSKSSRPKHLLWGIPGTVFACSHDDKGLADLVDTSQNPWIELSSHEMIEDNPSLLMQATLLLERQVHQGHEWAVQSSGARLVVFMPPAAPLTQSEIDAFYNLPFTRQPHPSYSKPIPAATMIQFSITTHRGCAAACTFCTLAQHQGRTIQSRSVEALIDEARRLTQHPDWKGTISDVGGPSANMWGTRCAANRVTCRRPDCLFPNICPSLKTSLPELAALLIKIALLEGVRHVRVASGIRYDLGEFDNPYLQTVIHEFVGGQLKVAPEHICDHVLTLMRKPGRTFFESFIKYFSNESQKIGKEQYIVPYLMSGFPGCTDEDMRELARWLKARNWRPQQVQCFIPVPGTVATAMFYAGIDTQGNPIPVARTDKERMRQHKILLGR